METTTLGIGLVTPVHHPDRECRWCRRTFTPSPYNQAPTQRYDRPQCGTAWRSRKRTLERYRDERTFPLRGLANESLRLPDPTDEAARRAMEAVELESSHQAWAELTLIRDALKRLQDGVYGVCDECGASIPEDRLAAVPWAARCVQCEERAA